MAQKKNKKKKVVARWDAVERQAYADGNRARATTFADRRKVASKRACRDFRWQD